MLVQYGKVSATSQEYTWNQPTLTSNGTLGGSSFAVTTNYLYTATGGGQAWNAFDDSNKRLDVYDETNGGDLIIYNPIPIKIICAEFNTTGVPSNYKLTYGNVKASNSNGSWTTLSSNLSKSGDISTFTINNNNFYKYYKFDNLNSNL